MAEGKVESVLEDLRAEEARLVKELADLAARRAEAEKELERVRAGICALSGKPAPKRKKGSSKKSLRPPALRVEEVADTVEEVLRSAQPLSKEDLERRVGELLQSRGRPRAGLRRKLEAALRTGRFRDGLSGWRLAEIHVKAHAEAAPDRTADPQPEGVAG